MLKPRVETHNVAGVLVAEFWDCLRLDPTPVQHLKSIYEEHIRKGGSPKLVIDLMGVTFAGSAALGNFVAIHRLGTPRGGHLYFCCVEPNVHEVFRVSKLESLFSFAPDRDAALRMIADGSTKSTPTAQPGSDAATKPPDPPRANSGGSPLRRSVRRDKLS